MTRLRTGALAFGILGAAVAAAAGAAALADPVLPPDSQIRRVPLGDIATAAAAGDSVAIPNPEFGPAAIQQGQALFGAMNCVSCHGYTAKGGMGPNLTDPSWRYGGTPVAIFKSIEEGRPQGMPAWGWTLPDQSIWAIVAYLQSLGGTYPADGFHADLQGDRPGDKTAAGLLTAEDLAAMPASLSAPGAPGAPADSSGKPAKPAAAGEPVPAPAGGQANAPANNDQSNLPAREGKP